MKKILIFFIAILFLSLSPIKSYAQTISMPPSQNLPLNTSSDVPKNFHSYTQVVILELMSAVSCQLSGINPLDPQGKCLGAEGKDGKIGFVENGGALGFMERGIAATYDLPVSSSQYIAYVTSNFGITKTANAAFGTGEGFKGLVPFIGIWSAFRNLMYLFFVLVFVLIGLGIMFRIKIDPRSVMTMQNVIPKIIIALILITFSYAIVGFMVDVMRVSTYFVYGVMSSIPNTDVAHLKPSDIQGSNPFTAANKLADDRGGISGISSSVTGVIVGSVKDAIGLGPGGDQGLAGLPSVPTIGGIVKGIINHIPGMGLITSFLSKIPFIGGFVDLLKDVGEGTVESVTNHSFANYLIHLVSFGAGLFYGFQAAQIPTPEGTVGGGGSIAGFGISGTTGFGPGFLVDLPMMAIVGTTVTTFTEVLLRELLPNLIVYFIILIALFTAMFRVWFQLIKAYIFLFLYLVFAPFFIAFGIIPGIETGPGSWIRNIAANLAVFPATYLMLLLGKVLIDSVGKSNGNVFVPPLIGDFSSSMAGFSAILGMGILLLTPEVVNIVRNALKAGDNKFGSAIGRSIGIGTGLAGKPISTIRHDLFGKDMMGAPKKGTEFMQRKFGPLGRIFSGGGIVPHGPSTKPPSGLSLKQRTLGRLTPGGRQAIAQQKSTNANFANLRSQTQRIKQSHDYKTNPGAYEPARDEHGEVIIGPDGEEFLTKKAPPSPGADAGTNPGVATGTPVKNEGDQVQDLAPDQAQAENKPIERAEGVPEISEQELFDAVAAAARGGAMEGARGALLAEAIRLAREDNITYDANKLSVMQPYINRAHANLNQTLEGNKEQGNNNEENTG